MTSCCDRRREDGIPDRINIDRAVAGQYAKLSPTELRLAIAILAKRGKGLNEIASHLNYSRSQVAVHLRLMRLRINP